MFSLFIIVISALIQQSVEARNTFSIYIESNTAYLVVILQFVVCVSYIVFTGWSWGCVVSPMWKAERGCWAPDKSCGFTMLTSGSSETHYCPDERSFPLLPTMHPWKHRGGHAFPGSCEARWIIFSLTCEISATKSNLLMNTYEVTWQIQALAHLAANMLYKGFTGQNHESYIAGFAGIRTLLDVISAGQYDKG